MIIIRPYTTTIDPDNHRTSLLHFENGAVKPFFMRGAIAWPNGINEGFALMAGHDLTDNTIILFEDFQFWTISHWLKEDKTVMPREGGGYHLGLIQFIIDNFQRYKCCSYFYGGQHIDLWLRFGREVYRTAMVPKEIEMIEVPYVKEVGDNLILEKLQTQKVKAQDGSEVGKAIKSFWNMRSAKGVDHGNGVMALRALLAGFEHQPWIDLARPPA